MEGWSLPRWSATRRREDVGRQDAREQQTTALMRADEQAEGDAGQSGSTARLRGDHADHGGAEVVPLPELEPAVAKLSTSASKKPTSSDVPDGWVANIWAVRPSFQWLAVPSG